MKNWKHIEDIFNGALALPATEREQYVNQQCGYDVEIKKQVLTLLRAQPESDSYMHGLSKKIYPLMGSLPNERIGHYRLIDVIGEGGMGVVFKALDEKLQRIVAIKFLSSIRAHNSRDKERFFQEAKAAARLHHPNVCEVYEIGESEDGYLFIVTAFCEGKNLASLIADNQLSLAATLDYLIQLCSALQSAHNQNIIHRDIKPGNVIVDPSGLIRLVDFGIAKVLGNDISVSDQLIGTFAYMSPEQFSGASIDPRSDVWSLGIVLYECLTGRRPWPSDKPAEVMYRIFNGNIPQLKGTDLPQQDGFNQILRRCLYTDKQMRFSGTELLANELRSIQRRLEQSDSLDIVPNYANAIETTQQTISKTLSEYRKVVALGLRLKNGIIDDDQLKVIKAAIKRHRGQLTDKRPNAWYAYFGFPKLGEGAADSALACALSLFPTADSPQQQSENGDTKWSTIIDLAVVHNAPIVITSDATSGTRQINGDIPGALENLICLSTPHPLLVSESANKRLRVPLSESAQWSSAQFYDDVLYCFDPSQVDEPVLSSNNQFKSPLLGRVHELGLLESTWCDVADGEGRAVVVTGEAGIGKSRLVHELKRNHSLIQSRHIILECSCDPNRQETSLFPIIRGVQLLSALGSAANIEDAKRFLNDIASNFRDRPQVLSWLLGSRDPELQSLQHNESPESLKHLGFALLEDIIINVAHQKPLLLIVEDLHWADTTTIEWLDRLLSQPIHPRIFMLLTGRPELFQRWRSYSVLSQLSLNKLSRVQVGDLIRSLLPNMEINETFVGTILQKTEGNPLFVEEYLKMLKERDALTDVDISAIPERLEDILLSRLDRLGGGKTVAQIASVIGREFNQSFVDAMVSYSKADIDANIARLLESEIIFRKDEDNFVFKHALIRDALYDSLSADERHRLHLALAKYLESEVEPGDKSLAETIATHYTNAQQFDNSQQWWLASARQAEERYANAEVIRLCQRGLNDNTKLAPSTENETMEFQLCLALGKAAMAGKGYANPMAGSAHERAVFLGRKLQRIEEAFPSMVGLWANYCVSAQHVNARFLADEMIAHGKTRNSPDLLVEAYMCAGTTAMFVGELEQSKNYFDGALSLYRSDMSRAHIRDYGQDPLVVIYSFYAIVEEALGNAGTALDYSNRCIAAARERQHPFSLAYALGFAVHIRIRQKQTELAQQLIDENRQLCEQHGIHVFQLLGSIQQGILYLALGKTREGIDALKTHIPEYKAMGAEIFLPTWAAVLAMSYLQLGQIELAENEYQNGVQQMRNSGEYFNKPILDAVSTQLTTLTNTSGE